MQHHTKLSEEFFDTKKNAAETDLLGADQTVALLVERLARESITRGII